MELSDVSDGAVCDSEFVKYVERCLKSGDMQTVLSAFQNEKYECSVRNYSTELVSVITKFIENDVASGSENLFECCSDLINLLAEKSEPDELLLQLLEEFDKTENDEMFLALLKPAQTVLKRMPPRRMNSFAWCFNAIHKYLRELPVPEEHYLSNEERLLLDCNENFIRITTLYSEVISFYDPFIEQLNHIERYRNEYRNVLLKFLVELLGKPLSHLDMDDSGKTVGKGRIIAEKIVVLIFRVCTDPYIFLEMQDDPQTYLESPSELSIGVLYYLITNNQRYSNNIPRVYNPVYIFQNSLKFVSQLLLQENQFCIEKGLFLANHVLKSVKHSGLPHLLLENTDHNRFCKHLSNVIIYCQIEELRKAALEILRVYLFSFDVRGRYLIIYNLVNTLNHTGLIGFITTKFKDMLASELMSNETDIPIYFRGEKLFSILHRFCHLPKKEESDLIELADQIIATLNLLRFLAIRDKNNVTSFRDYIPYLQSEYLEPLKKAIILSRGHYEFKVHELEQNQVKGSTEESQVTVTVSGQQLPGLPNSEKIKVVKSSLTALDMIDSLLCRLDVCIDSGHKV